MITNFLAATAGAFALIAGANEWLVRTHVVPRDTLERHVALFSSTASPYAAFGDSHVARGFNPQPPVVNLAYPSENLERMAWKVERYLTRVDAPKKVLIQADPHLFATYRLDAGLENYPELFSERRRIESKAFSKRYRPQLIALWRSFIRNGGRLASRIEMTPQGALLSPGNLANWPASRAKKFTQDRVTLHQPILNPSASAAAALYRGMVKTFVDRGAQVCLAALPTSPAYRAGVLSLQSEQQAAWAEAMAFYRNLAEAPGVLFVDHRDEISDASLFRDPDHLNKKGAIVYSRRLQEACFEGAEPERVAAAP